MNEEIFLKASVQAFCGQLINLIDKGHTEDIETIKKHMADNNLISYIIEKYENDSRIDFMPFKKGCYSIEKINNCFNNDFLFTVSGNESRKYNVSNYKNGLLLVLAICIGILN